MLGLVPPKHEFGSIETLKNKIARLEKMADEKKKDNTSIDQGFGGTLISWKSAGQLSISMRS